MNGTIDYVPVGDPTDRADAVCGIGSGPKLTIGSGDENNTFGCGTLIDNTTIMCALHTMNSTGPWNPGYHALPTDPADPLSRVARFRRKTNGTDPAGGVVVDYHQVMISGYRVCTPTQDIAIAYLAEPVTHIAPVSVVNDYTLAATNPVTLVGWGLDGTTLGAGSLPGDARLIDGTIDSIGGTGGENLVTAGPLSANLYDSGAGVFKEVGGVWRLVAVVYSVNGATGQAVATTLRQFEHTTSFQIPGLYSNIGESGESPTGWFFSDDTTIDSSIPTADNSLVATLLLKYTPEDKEPEIFNDQIFAGFDFSSLGRQEIAGASLFYTLGSANSIPFLTRFARIRRTGTTHLANWDTFNGTTPWTTAGAENTTTDVYTPSFDYNIPVAAADTEHEINDAELLQAVLAAQQEDSILRLKWESLVQDDNSLLVHSREALLLAHRPRLVLTFVADRSRKKPGRESGLGLGMGFD
jgi:hypothetical protein